MLGKAIFKRMAMDLEDSKVSGKQTAAHVPDLFSDVCVCVCMHTCTNTYIACSTHTDGPNFVDASLRILREIHEAILPRTPALAYLHAKMGLHQERSTDRL